MKDNKITISKEEIEAYYRGEGTPYPDSLDIEYMTPGGEKQWQYNECVKNQYCLSDFERWQILQKLLGVEMEFATAMKIDKAL